MVTIEQLQGQKKRILKQKLDLQNKQKIKLEKIELQKEIKILQRSPSTSKNIRLAKRTGKGFAVLSKKVGSAAIRQFKRIKEQQLRDEAALRKGAKKIKKIKTGQKLSKIKERKGFDVFSNLDF